MVTVFIKILSKTHHMGFIHTDMDAFCSEAVSACTDHCLNESISLLFAAKQNIIKVPNFVKARPAQCGIQMSKRLNTGDQLDAIGCGIIIHFL